MRCIENYALLGDLQSAALVERGGSIDWACFPRFDSGACFAALLGGPEHGRWSLAPTSTVLSTERRYREDTLILETVHETAEGSVRVIDFMPPRGEAPDIVRIVEGLTGRVPLRSELVIRFDYGRIVPWVRRVDGARLAVAGPDALCFRTPAEVRGEEMTTVSELTVGPGDRIPFVLTWFPSHQDPPRAIDPEHALRDAEEYWQAWAAGCRHHGAYHEVVHFSLMILKALTYAPTGGVIAAPTTSLPEKIGGVRNWDYRFCWLRDAALTLSAMLRAGYTGESCAWRDWLTRAVAGDAAEVQIMYGLAGERRIDEYELDWLPGFEGSRPVRIGNAASKQLQLDVYGEVLDAHYQSLCAGIEESPSAWAMLKRLLLWLDEGWKLKDAGIWEVRGPARHFTHSKVMAWVAYDRAIRIVEEHDHDGPVDHWKTIRAEIEAEVLAKGWSERRGSFTQSYGSDELDASLLLLPIVGFIPADDPRMVAAVEAIRQELTVDGLVHRYKTAEACDGLPAGEGAFLACSFWLVEVLALQGKVAEAQTLFDHLLTLRNDVGLLAEEYDTTERRQLGNVPQAFTHLTLVTAALAIDEAEHASQPSETTVAAT